MDKIQDKGVKEFVENVKKEFNPEKIILFGSRAVNKEWKRSDYDFIIISKKFKGIHWLERISKILKYWKLVKDLDVLPYTPEEFEDKKKNSSTVRNAVKYGKVLAS